MQPVMRLKRVSVVFSINHCHNRPPFWSSTISWTNSFFSLRSLPLSNIKLFANCFFGRRFAIAMAGRSEHLVQNNGNIGIGRLNHVNSRLVRQRLTGGLVVRSVYKLMFPLSFCFLSHRHQWIDRNANRGSLLFKTNRIYIHGTYDRCHLFDWLVHHLVVLWQTKKVEKTTDTRLFDFNRGLDVVSMLPNAGPTLFVRLAMSVCQW